MRAIIVHIIIDWLISDLYAGIEICLTGFNTKVGRLNKEATVKNYSPNSFFIDTQCFTHMPIALECLHRVSNSPKGRLMTLGAIKRMEGKY